MYNRIGTTAIFIASLGLFNPGTALSQSGLEEIVVTARKISESIQDVPLSISSFSSQDIQNQAIISVDDVAKFTPGLFMSNYTGKRDDPGLIFRGMESGDTGRQAQLASAFVDGIYLTGSSQWVSMNDIERVEVVKGPQSAFFGRATFGGAVNFITKTPGNDWRGDTQLIVGENRRGDFSGSFEGPIIEDKLAFRLSGRFYTYDGAWDNDFPGGEKLGAQETTSANLTLYATPTDNISIKFTSLYSKDDDGAGVSFLQLAERNNCGPFFDPSTAPDIRPTNYYCGTLSTDGLDALAVDTSVDLTAPGASWPKKDFGLTRSVNLNSLDIRVDVGGYTLSSLTGVFREDLENMSEQIPGELLIYSTYEDTTFSQELRLNSPLDKRLRWMAGLYYLDISYDKQNAGFGCATDTMIYCTPALGPTFFGGVGRGAFGGLFGIGSGDLPASTVVNQAVFGSLSYDITDQLTLNLEARHANEELDYGQVIVQEAPAGQTGAEVKLNAKFKSTTPRIILDYKANEDTMIYLSYSEGNNPGGFNTQIVEMAPEAAKVFQDNFGVGSEIPEGKLKNYEVGIKHSFANGRGFVNGGVYFMEWTNQAFKTFLKNVDTNGDGVYVPGEDRPQIDFSGSGSTDIRGFEVSAGYALSDNWTASLSYNYNDTKIKKYLDAPYAEVFGTYDASGQEVAHSPKNSGVVSISFNMPAARGGEWFGRLDSIYQDITYAWVHNLAKTPASVRSNIRGGWRNDRYSVSLWVENLTDEDSPVAARRFTSGLTTPASGFKMHLPNPREFGMTFQARFGQR